MFNVQIVPQSALPPKPRHVSISVVEAIAASNLDRLVTLDELIANSR